MIIALFRRWRRKRYLRHHLVQLAEFSQVLNRVPACRGLDTEARDRLRRLVTLFLHEKRFEPAADAEIDHVDKLLIAIYACLPVLNIGIEAYDHWVTLIVYPEEFLVDVEVQDQLGIVHSGRDLRAGEAWDRGPLVISLRDVRAGAGDDGYNVVIHECAHQLDMLSASADGCPELHRGMSYADWSAAFTQAWRDLVARLERGEETPLDAYAAQSPAECFAVFSEYFFEAPHKLRDAYPLVYEQMRLFYRQDTADRMK